MQSVLEAVEQHLDAAELKSRLNKCSSIIVANWKDEDSLDLVHYSILNNNLSALVLLLSRRYFKSPHEPNIWPYLHLVACMGQRSFISSIIQELKFQNDPSLLDWDIFDKKIKSKIKTFVPNMEKAEKTKMHTPIDVAALFGHTGCVLLLLDFWQVQGQNKTSRRTKSSSPSMYLSLACRVNSPNALRLLLKDHPDKIEALECALRMSSPECVDVVLRGGEDSDMKKAFHGMNLFHVLYSYNSCLTVDQYEAMVQITSILIRHRQDVNTLRPSRTFPLYSLLSHSIAGTTITECGPPLQACLLILLKAGADPNVDEILIEETLQDSEQCTAFGRRPYGSAINCLLSSLPSLKFGAKEDPVVANSADDYACKCIDLLLRHGADLSLDTKFASDVHEFGFPARVSHSGTALHVMISTRSQCPLSFQILRLVLHYGVNADARGCWHFGDSKYTIHYALNILPMTLWSMPLISSETHLDEYLFTAKDLDMFQYIMKFMSQKSLSLAQAEFIDSINALKQFARETNKFDIVESVLHHGSKMFMKILTEFEHQVTQPWQLQKYCAHTVWRSCRFHLGNIYDLPIPGPLRNVILQHFY